MVFQEGFVSNTAAGSGNQLYFASEARKVSRAFFRVTQGGEYDYALLFSNLIDSTYADGAASHANLVCEGWTLHEARVGRCAALDWHGEELCPEAAVEDVRPLTFAGKAEKQVAPGEFFESDPVRMQLAAGEFLVLEMAFSGPMIPYHEESLLPIFAWDGQTWRYDRRMPLPGRVGCRRDVRHRVGFLGDSITQGIGTELNSYAHWNAVLADMLGEESACWNLGIGYGRASDAASDGAWLHKAKHNDAVVVCYGVNDINQGQDAALIKADLAAIVRRLKQAGCRVLLQTVPPFDYDEAHTRVWQEVNAYLRSELKHEADAFFDAALLLAKSAEEPQNARYGGHPDAAGCAVWARALYPVLREMLEA